MAKHVHRLITGLCLLAGLGTSGPVGATDGISLDPAYYERKRAQIRQACEEFEVQGTEPSQKIYDILPDSFAEYMVVFYGTEIRKLYVEDEFRLAAWTWLGADDRGDRCHRLIDSAVKKLSPAYVFGRIRTLIANDTFDLRTIDPISAGNSKVAWPTYHHLFDYDLQPTWPGAPASGPNGKGVRRKQFGRLIEREDDLTIKKFVLFIGFHKNGSPASTLGDDPVFVRDLRRGWGIRFASKALIAESPKWYKAYNDLVPMLCGRLNNWTPTAQKACLTRDGKPR